MAEFPQDPEARYEGVTRQLTAALERARASGPVKGRIPGLDAILRLLVEVELADAERRRGGGGLRFAPGSGKRVTVAVLGVRGAIERASKDLPEPDYLAWVLQRLEEAKARFRDAWDDQDEDGSGSATFSQVASRIALLLALHGTPQRH